MWSQQEKLVGNSQLETGRDLRLETGEWSNGRNGENIWVRRGFTILYRRNIPPSSGPDSKVQEWLWPEALVSWRFNICNNCFFKNSSLEASQCDLARLHIKCEGWCSEKFLPPFLLNSCSINMILWSL